MKSTTIKLFLTKQGKKSGGYCHQGYKGRFAIIETLPISDAIKELILCGKSSLDIKKQSMSEGMITLRASGLHKIRAGQTTVEEVVRETVL